MMPDGSIVQLDELSEAEKKLALRIPPEDLKFVRGMNRKDRRAWYAQKKKELRRERRRAKVRE